MSASLEVLADSDAVPCRAAVSGDEGELVFLAVGTGQCRRSAGRPQDGSAPRYRASSAIGCEGQHKAMRRARCCRVADGQRGDGGTQAHVEDAGRGKVERQRAAADGRRGAGFLGASKGLVGKRLRSYRADDRIFYASVIFLINKSVTFGVECDFPGRRGRRCRTFV